MPSGRRKGPRAALPQMRIARSCPPSGRGHPPLRSIRAARLKAPEALFLIFVVLSDFFHLIRAVKQCSLRLINVRYIIVFQFILFTIFIIPNVP